MNLCSISIEKVLDLGVLKVLRVAVASVVQLCVGLGDTGLLKDCQGNIGLSGQAVEDDLSQKTED